MNTDVVLHSSPRIAPSEKAPLRFSIITICFNAREALERTIRSVNAQSYPNVEHVIIDGGSADGSSALIQDLASRDVRWVSEKDQGISDAFNKGTRLASGDYLCYLNAGDVFAGLDTLSKVAERLAMSAENPGIAFGDFICESDDGAFVTRASAELAAFRGTNPLNHQSVFIPREIALRFPYDPHLKLGMDYDLWLRLLRSGQSFRPIGFPIARFVVDGRSSDPAWAVHNLAIRHLLWRKYEGGRIGVGDIAGLLLRALVLRANHVARRWVGRRLIRKLKSFGLRRRGRFSREVAS